MGVESFEAIASVLIRAAEQDESNPMGKRITVRFAGRAKGADRSRLTGFADTTQTPIR